MTVHQSKAFSNKANPGSSSTSNGGLSSLSKALFGLLGTLLILYYVFSGSSSPLALRCVSPMPSRPIPMAAPKSPRGDILVKTVQGSRRSLHIFNADMHHGTTLDVMSMVMVRGGTLVYGADKDLWHTEWLKQKLPGTLVRATSSKRLAPMLLDRNIVDNAQPSYIVKHQQDLFDYYKNDTVMQSVDAFICTFPVVLCEAFFAFNKTIIFAAAHRYSMRRCSSKLWQATNKILQRAEKSTNPRHYVAALSRYDAEYINYFTGIDAIHLYSSSMPYVPHLPFRPKRKEILVGPLNIDYIPFEKELVKHKNFTFGTARMLYGMFRIAQLAEHRAAVLFPYAVMSYGITELYAMAIPLFVPSVRMMMAVDHIFPLDRTMTGTKLYCGEKNDYVPKKHPSSSHTQSPESLTKEAKEYWLKFADFHLWPHIQHFDNISDLVLKLEKSDFYQIHKAMVAENEKRMTALDQSWRTIATGMDAKHRETPKKFHVMDNFLSKLDN